MSLRTLRFPSNVYHTIKLTGIMSILHTNFHPVTKTSLSTTFHFFITTCWLLLATYGIPLHSASIVIDNKTYSIDTLAHFKVGPGTYYTSLRLRSNNRLDVFFLKADATNPHLTFKAALGRDSIYMGEQPSVLANRKSKEGAQYFAGTNGDFYVTAGYVGLPTGCTLIDGQIATPPAGNRKSIAFNEQQQPAIGLFTYGIKAKLKDEVWTIDHVNHLREANQLVLFNQHNGKGTRTNPYGTEVLIKLQDGEIWGVNKTLKAKVIKIETGKGNMSLPAGHAVLSGHGTSQTLLNTLAENDELTIEITMTLDGINDSYSNAIGGEARAPMLKNGVVELTDVWNELHPRTGIGYSEDKKTVIFCVVDGRGLSAGVTTKQLAQIMQSAGAYTAFNMDGGGSSSMYVKSFGPMNVPSDGTERAVANSIFAVSTAPTDNTVAEIKPYNTTIKLPKFGVFKPMFLGYNQYGMLINKDLQGVVLSCSPQVGEIAADGRFVASGNDGGFVTATYNGITTLFRVELVTSAEIAFRLDSILIDSRREYPIQVQSVIGLNTMDVLPAALTWKANNPSVCSIENGVLKGLQNGSTYITGTLGDFKDSLKVNVEVPEYGKLVVDSFSTNSWSLEASSALNAVLNYQNLPENWTYGSVVNYVFNSTRAPFIKLIGNMNLYSLPDTIKFTYNIGDISCSKLIFSFRANNSTTDITKEFTGFTQNSDLTISFPVESLFNVSDISVYPIRLNYLNFYLNSQTSGQAYRLALKDIILSYKGYAVSGTLQQFIEGLFIYPNPVKNKQLIIRLDNNNSGILNVNFFSTAGQLVYSENIKSISKNEYNISLDKMTPGTYIIKVNAGNEQYSSTVLIQ